MSMFRIDYERVYAQVKMNEALKRLEWKPSDLKDNIFDVIAIIRRDKNLKMKGEPYLIKKKGTKNTIFKNRIWAWDFDYKDNPSRRENE